MNKTARLYLFSSASLKLTLKLATNLEYVTRQDIHQTLSVIRNENSKHPV